MELNRVYCEDCLEGMKRMPDNSVDLIVTDPPYNIGKDFANENMSSSEFIKWSESWIKECVRVLKWGGAIYVCMGWQYAAEIKIFLSNQDSLRLKNWIIWYRQDGWKGDNGFAHSHEHILYFMKDNIPSFDLVEFGNHVRKKRIEAGYKTVDKLMEVMGIYTLVHRESGKDGYYSGSGFVESGKKIPSLSEMIKLNELLNLDSKYHIDVKNIDKKVFNVLFNKTDVCDDVWLSPKSEKKRMGHPTQKPVVLMSRIIKASSNEGDIILDPFMGSGTTAIASKQLNRKFIGFELDPEYCKIIEKRLAQKTIEESFGEEDIEQKKL